MSKTLDLFNAFADNSESENENADIDDDIELSNDEAEFKGNTESRKRKSTQDEDVLPKKSKEDDADVDVINMDECQNRVVITTLETQEACTHEVASPPSNPYEALKPPSDEPAKKYPFTLDPFQKEAILCIENNQSVLVSAHTSAGKTVVAEYAIALSLKNQQRVIYTTPIKALSNQKYRDFSEEFGDVGLITGDVTINPNAVCLIMTTEILRNMLYRGSEVTREVGWVIFDEIHYMRDKERGVVWEESLILLPHNVRYVFLSATIPNARQFAEWVCYLHKQPCHVVYTDYRPTPLQHYIYPSGGEGIHLVVDEKGQFKEDNFNQAMALFQNAGDKGKTDLQRGRKGGFKTNAEQTSVFQLVKMVMEKNFAPVIVFSFSKKDCESYAMQVSKLDFNTTEEKQLVDDVFKNAMDVLKPEDQKIPQVENVLPFLRRGIGIHHGGLLPILKETIEIMFSEGLIKALFATETFAMGLNMPARTVIFTGMNKFDGQSFRPITSGEYIQMSGRAGRRGLDDKGIVILMITEKVSPNICKEIVKGLPDPIYSAFHLTYNMVLNLLRVDGINPEYIMERSFFQFQNMTLIPQLYEKYLNIRKEYQKLKLDVEEDALFRYHHLNESLAKSKTDYQNYINKPEVIVPFLKPGRMIKMKKGSDEFEWGVVVNFRKTKPPMRRNIEQNVDSAVLTIDVLMYVEKINESDDFKPCNFNDKGTMEVLSLESKHVVDISSVRIHLPEDLRPPDNRKSVKKLLQQVLTRFNNKVPLLDPINDLKISDPEFKQCQSKIKNFEELIEKFKTPEIVETYEQYLNKLQVKKSLQAARKELIKTKSLLQMEELSQRKKILFRLGYSEETDVIKLKGRVACELSCTDELLVTELLFNGVFDKLSPPLAVSLLSCLVCDEKSQQMPTRAEELSGVLRIMQNFASKIAKVSNECNLKLKEEDYVESFKPFLMDVVYAWCNGSTFLEVCQMTDIFEGSIIRSMRRLEELLRELCQASKIIGNADLEQKFTEGIRLIKRDIVFAASLYL